MRRTADSGYSTFLITDLRSDGRRWDITLAPSPPEAGRLSPAGTRTIRAVVRLGVERWADEDAAAADGVRDRDLAGRALARVALQRHRIHAMGPSRTRVADATAALAAASLQVSTRVQALFDPPRPSRVSRILLLSGVSVIVLAAGIIGLAHTNDLIEMAQFNSPHP